MFDFVPAIWLYVTDCQPLPVPADGSLSTEDLISGTNVTVTCGDGFTLFGEKHLHCHNNGSWSSTVGKCLKGNYILICG